MTGCINQRKVWGLFLLFQTLLPYDYSNLGSFFFENIDEFFFCCKYRLRWYFHPQTIIMIDSFIMNDYLAFVFFSCFQKVKNSISKLSKGKMTKDLVSFLKIATVYLSFILFDCIAVSNFSPTKGLHVHVMTHDQSLHFI